MDKLDERAGVTTINLVKMYNDLVKESGLHEKYGSISLKTAEFDPNGDLTLPSFVYEKDGMVEEWDFELGTMKMRREYNNMAIEYNKILTQERIKEEVDVDLKLSEIEQKSGRGLARPIVAYIDRAFGYGAYMTGIEVAFDVPDADGRCPATLTLCQEENYETDPPIAPKRLKEYEVADIFDDRELESVIADCSDTTTLSFGDYRMGRNMPTMARPGYIPSEITEIGFLELPDDMDDIGLDDLAQEQEMYSNYGMPFVEGLLPEQPDQEQNIEQEDTVLA